MDDRRESKRPRFFARLDVALESPREEGLVDASVDRGCGGSAVGLSRWGGHAVPSASLSISFPINERSDEYGKPVGAVIPADDR